MKEGRKPIPLSFGVMISYNEYFFEKLDYLYKEDVYNESQRNRLFEMLESDDSTDVKCAYRILFCDWLEYEGIIGYSDDIYELTNAIEEVTNAQII